MARILSVRPGIGKLPVEQKRRPKGVVGGLYYGTLCSVKDIAGLIGWWPGNGTPADVIGGNSGVMLNGASYSRGKVSMGFALDGKRRDHAMTTLTRPNKDAR